MWIFLSNPNKNNRLSSSVNHIQCSSNFVIYSIKFGHNNSINHSWILFLNCKVNQWLVELGKLVNWIISNQCFSHKQNNIRLIYVNKFCKCFHQRLISLHSPGGVNQYHIIFLTFCLLNCLFGNNSWVVLVAFVIQRYLKTLCMCHQLLDSTRSKIITSCKHHI